LTFLSVAQGKHPVSWQFSSERIAPLTYKLKIEATVKEPYHIYPQASANSGLGKPTEILFDENPNVEFVGEMEEKGIEQTGDADLAFYAKGVTFTQTLKLKSDSNTSLTFTIKYMACTNEMCLPPAIEKYKFAINDQDTSVRIVQNISDTVSAEKGIAFDYEDFVMPDIERKNVSSKNITSKSKYTLIDFWASWCIPCRAQGRELIPIYNKYHAAGFNVLAISLDTDLAAWKKAISADGYTWSNLSDLKGFKSAMCKKYAITAIPRNFIINEKGVIIAKDLHGKALEKKIAELFE